MLIKDFTKRIKYYYKLYRKLNLTNNFLCNKNKNIC